mmetsp:Transcript_17566/g.41259  ORF Transcript_17566/g.41259 Transcript_17566/m.41259 type:complete len:282 (-) Transcript_17566:926-1771(-)
MSALCRATAAFSQNHWTPHRLKAIEPLHWREVYVIPMPLPRRIRHNCGAVYSQQCSNSRSKFTLHGWRPRSADTAQMKSAACTEASIQSRLTLRPATRRQKGAALKLRLLSGHLRSHTRPCEPSQRMQRLRHRARRCFINIQMSRLHVETTTTCRWIEVSLLWPCCVTESGRIRFGARLGTTRKIRIATLGIVPSVTKQFSKHGMLPTYWETSGTSGSLCLRHTCAVCRQPLPSQTSWILWSFLTTSLARSSARPSSERRTRAKGSPLAMHGAHGKSCTIP